MTFILSLAASAFIQMGEHEDGTGGGPVNLPLAKQTIDMVGMLREKPAATLAPDGPTSSSALYKLRMRYLELKAARRRRRLPPTWTRGVLSLGLRLTPDGAPAQQQPARPKPKAMVVIGPHGCSVVGVAAKSLRPPDPRS